MKGEFEKEEKRNSMVTHEIKTCREAIFQNKLFDMLIY